MVAQQGPCLRHMPPGLALDGIHSGHLGDAETLRDLRIGQTLRSPKVTHLLNLLRCQLRTLVLLPPWESVRLGARTMQFAACMAALRAHVSHVLCMGTQPQVPHVDTHRIVAAVQDMQPRRDRAIGQAPCRTMGQPLPTSPTDDPVAMLIPPACPPMAGIRTSTAIHQRLKAEIEGYRLGWLFRFRGVAPFPRSIVTRKRGQGLALAMAQLRAIARRKLRGLTTTARTQPDKLQPGWSSIGLHGFLLRSCATPRRVPPRGAFLCLNYSIGRP